MSENNNDTLNFDEFIQGELNKDPALVKEILEEEISEYKETNDITYVLKNLGRIVAILGFPYFEEKTNLSRVTIYGVIKRKMPLDMMVINKLLKAINFSEI